MVEERISKFTIPWPPKQLSPNARVHWAQKAKAARQYRTQCAYIAQAQGLHGIGGDHLEVEFVFYPPTKRRHDLDNLIARIKSGIDGIADATGVDDSKWRMLFSVASQTIQDGNIEVTVKFS